MCGIVVNACARFVGTVRRANGGDQRLGIAARDELDTEQAIGVQALRGETLKVHWVGHGDLVRQQMR